MRDDDVIGVMLERGGVTGRADLVRAGADDWTIRSLVARGVLIRLRRGWFALPGAEPALARAAEFGAAVACVSALARAGVWLPPGETRRLHVRPNGYGRRTESPRDVRFCSLPGDRATSHDRLVDAVPDAVIAAARCQRGPDLVAVLDSVLHRRLLGPGELAEILRDQPRRVQRALAAVDGSAESGSETRVRLYLRARRLRYRTQVFIPGVGTVDLLVGRRLVVEADSQTHHGGESIDDDRDRDLELHRLGFIPFRASYRQIHYAFHRVAAALEAIISSGMHLGRPAIDP